MNEQSDPIWDQIKDLAISRLKGSSASGLKKLKTVTVWGWDRFDSGPVLEMEEVVV